MNLISRLLPVSAPQCDVAAAVASVAKPVPLVEAQSELEAVASADRKITLRMQAIAERRNIQTIDGPIFASEAAALDDENLQLNRDQIILRDRTSRLRKQIAELMPPHARAVALALVPSRRRAAEQLLESVRLAEAALADIAISNRCLMDVGLSPASSFALPYSAALKGLAAKVQREQF